MYNLDYPVMKTERAKTHLDALNRELNIFLSRDDTLVRKYYEKGSRYICRTEFAGVPKIVGMLLGEFLYCMRSGLDQLAWHLALQTARDTEDSAHRVCFPIFETIAGTKNWKNWQRVIKLFPNSVAGVIEALQPYKGPGSPKDHALWQLNALCNIDKHRIIPIHSQEAPIFVPITDPPARIEHLDDPDAIEVSVSLADAAKLKFDPKGSMTIVFGEWGSDFVIPRERLSEIYNFVRDNVIPRFSRFISKAPESPVMRVAGATAVHNG